MKLTTVVSENEKTDFAVKAASHFTLHPNHRTFSDGDIKAGALFACRWGLGDDCVLVFKLDSDFEPLIYQQAIRKEI